MRGGIDEETLEIRAVEITSSSIGDAPMLPDLLAAQLKTGVPPSVCFNTDMICASLNRPFFIVNLLRYLAEKILLLNTITFRGGLPEHQSTWVAHCGGKSPDTTAEAASKRSSHRL
jgi:hypothetical protein